MARAETDPRREPGTDDATTERARPRLGPRPLPLHLMAASLAWTSSQSAWPASRNGSLPWKPALAEAAAELRRELESVAPEAFAAALERAVAERSLALAEGILAYRRHPYRRDLTPPPVVWREGTSRLLEYGVRSANDAAAVPGDDTAPPILIVPSLINRAYILDLEADNSLLRWLAAAGLRPLLLDWDRPGAEERRFTLTDYVAGRLEAALDAVRARTGRRPVVLGYCMGGLLALALAQRRPEDLAGLALLATPWDFHAEMAGQAKMMTAALVASAPLLDGLGELPVDVIQALFAGLDPQLTPRKFVAFARLDPASRAARAFVALEDWVNDGVPLAAPVARECLAGWYGENTAARGLWRVAGRPVLPGEIALPSLCVIPARDRIVPPGSAMALARAIPGAACWTPAAGHIGMIVGRGARSQVWEPLRDWLAARRDRA